MRVARGEGEDWEEDARRLGFLLARFHVFTLRILGHVPRLTLVWLRALGLLGLTHWLAGYHTPVPQLEVTPTSTKPATRLVFAPFRLPVHPLIAVFAMRPLVSRGRKHSATVRMCGAARCLSK